MRCRGTKTARELTAPLVVAGLIVGLTAVGVMLRKNGLSEDLFNGWYAIMFAAIGAWYAISGGGCCRSRRAPREPRPAETADDSLRRWPGA